MELARAKTIHHLLGFVVSGWEDGLCKDEETITAPGPQNQPEPGWGAWTMAKGPESLATRQSRRVGHEEVILDFILEDH